MKIFKGIVAVALMTGALQVLAQAYPQRPVRVIIGFPPGSGTDVMGRVVISRVGEFWGQNLVADNRGGAGGSIAGATASKAAPDGYTLLINSSAHAVNPSIYAKLPYDTLKDFIDISLLAIQANVLIVPNGSQHKTLPDFLKAARAKPKGLNFAFAGVGSGTHLNNDQVRARLRTPSTPTWRTRARARRSSTSSAGAWTPTSRRSRRASATSRRGKVRAIAISTAKRSAQLPERADDRGVRRAGIRLRAVVRPVGAGRHARRPVVDKIAKDFTRALQDKPTVDKLTTLGNELNVMTPPQFAKFVRQQIVRSSPRW